MTTYVPLVNTLIQLQDTSTSDNMLNGTIEFFLAGLSTPTNLFSDNIGTSIGTSITLNSGGYPESGGNVIALWRDASIALKLVFKDAAGDEIDTFNNIPAVDASALLYNQGGTNANDRTTTDRLQDITFLNDYAVGDGATDDSTAITNALSENTYVKGKPGSTYFIASTVTIGAGKALDLTGCTLQFANANAIYGITVTGDNACVFGGKIGTVNLAGAYLLDQGAIEIQGTANGAGVAPNLISGTLIMDVNIDQVGEYGVKAWYTSGTRIERNTFTKCGYMSCSALSPNKLQFVDNLCEDNTTGPSPDLSTYGISMARIDNSSTDTTRYPVPTDCDVAGNRVKNIPNFMGLQVKDGLRCHFTDNKLYDCRIGAGLVGVGVGCIDCTITHNVHANLLARTNIGGTPDQNRQHEVWLDAGVSGALNLRNRIEFNTSFQGGAGIGTSGAVNIQWADGGSCSHNELMEPYSVGIVAVTEVDNYVIDNNTIIDVKSAGTGGSPAMNADNAIGIRYRDSEFNNITCTNNTIIRRDSTVDTYVSTIGVSVADVSTKSIFFAGNKFSRVLADWSIGTDVTGLTGPDIVHTFTAADSTPSVKGGRTFLTDTGALGISDLDDGVPGQEITIISKGIITFDTTGTNLTGSSVDLVTAAGDVTTWACEDGTTWILKGYVDVSVDNSAGA